MTTSQAVTAAVAHRTELVGPSPAEKIRNAEVMYGTGSRQHLAALKRFGRAAARA